MDAQQVILFGNSLLIAGLAAQLGAMPGLVVQRVVTAAALRDCCPAVVVFDLSTVRAELVLGWLTDCAHLSLVGLDLQRSRVMVFTAGAVPIASVEQLGELVGRLVPGAPRNLWYHKWSLDCTELNPQTSVPDASSPPNQRSTPDTPPDELAELRLARFSLDRSGDAVLWIASDARILYVNEATCVLLGYSRDELLQLRITDINAEVAPAEWPERWHAVRVAGVRRSETRHRRKDGVEVPIEVTSRYLEYAGQAYICSFVRDISERKQAEARLRRWAEIFEHTTTGVVVSEAGSTAIDLANPAFARMYGASVAELLGTPIADLYPPECRGDYLRARAQLSEQDHVVFESRHRRRDGSTFPVLVDAAAMRKPRRKA